MTADSRTIYSVEITVWPWNSPEVEYFETKKLAYRVADFYHQHSPAVCRGIEVQIKPVEVIPTDQGFQLADTNTICEVKNEINLQHLHNLIQRKALEVKNLSAHKK